MTACPLCHRPGADRHDRCRDDLDKRLANMPGLYALLEAVLEPGVSPGTRVSGSRTAPLPVRLEPLSLRSKGGIVTILATWEDDWRDVRGLSPASRQDSDRALVAIIEFLRTHLEWAIDHHPAISEFAAEVHDITEACYAAAGIRIEAMRIGPCPTVDDNGRPCGRQLYADPYLDMIRCTKCRAEWPRSRWLILGGTLNQTRTDHAA